MSAQDSVQIGRTTDVVGHASPEGTGANFTGHQV